MSAWPGTGGLEPLPEVRAPPIWPLAMKAGMAGEGVAMVQNSSIDVLVAELRASCQQTAMLPDSRLLAILGRNWLRIGTAGSSLTLIGGVLQVRPSSSEKRTMMSVSLFSSVGSSV